MSADHIATVRGLRGLLKKAGKQQHGPDSLPASSLPWKLETEVGDEPYAGRYATGIREASGERRWVVRFDDDYGTDQWADAELIVAAVNGLPELLARLDAIEAELAALTKERDEALHNLDECQEGNWPWEWVIASQERERRKAAEADRDQLAEALAWFDFIEDVDTTGMDDGWAHSVTVTRTAKGWRKAQALYRAALAASRRAGE